MKRLLGLCLCFLLWVSVGTCPTSFGEETGSKGQDALQQQFHDRVIPLLTKYCNACHEGSSAEAMLDLAAVRDPSQVAERHQTWAEVIHRVREKEMPPEDAEVQPSDAERAELVAWVEAFRKQEAERNAGDPGYVPVRRLSNSELNYTVRDLTGVDIRPASEFPIDPANEAGFDNSADSLTISPALLNKALAAARHVAEHLVLTPDGIAFAPHPVVTETDRDKYCVKRIVEFYQRQKTDYADYLFAAWQMKVAPDQFTRSHFESKGLSGKYLQLVNDLLKIESPIMPSEGDADGIGPIAIVRRMWLDLPASIDAAVDVRASCEKIRDFIVQRRSLLEPELKNLEVRGIHSGAQPFVLWKNDQYASYRQRPFMPGLEKLIEGVDDERLKAALTVPSDEEKRKAFIREVERFCRLFPDAFYISERGRDYVGKPKAEQEKGRLLSAGFHSMMGYYRDDEPLMKLMLTAEQADHLDRLWQELDFITSAPMRQYTGFVWFERTDSVTMRSPEFDFARAEDKSVTTPAMIERLAATYLKKADNLGAGEIPRAAIENYFRKINAQIQWVEKSRRLAEPHHVEAMIRFASDAYRRDLTDQEQAEVRSFYASLRREGATHEEAIEDLLVTILMTPECNFRVDLAARGSQVEPLNAVDLASRLSYFLWSSMPDRELRELARSGELTKPEVLSQQVRRMLRDQKVRGLATEFGGQWLDFRRFEQHNSVDRERFPAFNDALRSAMFEEPVRFLEHLIREDKSVLDCLYADYVWVNAPLAAHYGIELPMPLRESESLDSDGWHLVPQVQGRGGLLTMGVFLTQNAPGRRTSPVKRGYWVVRRLLGERIPAPPPNVPDLPTDESQLGERTLREVLAKHREHTACAGCHNRFDSIGLVFESYGPVGELREVDLAGKPVDTQAVFPSGQAGTGVNGLKDYLRQHREADFVDNLTRKLLAFGLGRTLLLSDEPLLEKLREQVRAGDATFSRLAETIVLSPQFLNKRGR